MALVITHPAIAKQGQQTGKSELPIGDSSYLMHIAYDAQAMQMTVTMKNGAQYLYFQVYPQTMESFIQSQSKGKFYAEQIRGKHQSSRTVNKSVGRKISKVSKKEGNHD